MKQAKFEMGRPNSEPQKAFFTSRTKYTAYGGARGGGKSWAVQRKAALMALRYGGIRILILRRTFPELRENHILPMLALLNGVAEYKQAERRFYFPNGSAIVFGYCASETDVNQYQGQEYDAVFLDEATQFTQYQFATLTACIRGANDFPKRMYLTCNPGGVGHAWVKRLFVSRKYEPGEDPKDYKFIRASVYDNATLMEKDPDYVRKLENLPTDLRRAWLDGDWDVFAGQYFDEWRPGLHTCEPIHLPGHWRRYFAMDYGLDMLAGYFIAVDDGGRAYVYREVCASGLTIPQAAERILAAWSGETIEQWIAPPDMWNRRQDTGRSVAEGFAERGILLTRAENRRVQGWMALKEYLMLRADGLPGLRVFTSCPYLAESMPNLLHDSRDPNDVAAEPHEYTHGPDAIRYFVAARPQAAQTPVLPDEDLPAEYEDQMDDFFAFGC